MPPKRNGLARVFPPCQPVGSIGNRAGADYAENLCRLPLFQWAASRSRLETHTLPFAARWVQRRLPGLPAVRAAL